MVERFNRRINEAIAQRGKITDNSGKILFILIQSAIPILSIL
jgi:hypothetical protein